MGYHARIDFTASDGTRYRGAHHLASIEPLLTAAQTEDDWTSMLPANATAVGLLSERVLRVHLDVDGDTHDLVVKRIPPAPLGVFELPIAWWLRSRAHRAYTWSHRLRAFGLTTPRTLGYLERRSFSRQAPSVIVTEWVEAPTLEHLRDRGFESVDKAVLLDRLAALLSTMHTHRLLHADLHVGNVLVGDDELFVLDLESMRPLGRRASVVIKNLVRLNRDFLDTRLVSRTDRMRFLDRYLRHQADRRARRRTLFDQIQRRTEAKLLERGDRFDAVG